MLNEKKFTAECQELKIMSQNIRTRLSKTIEELENSAANVPMRHYSPEDRIALAQPCRQPASMREAVPGVNVPAHGETWQQLNDWRAAYGLPPVTR